MTGLSNQSADINGKRIDLLREAVPGLRKLAVMANVGSPIGVLEIREVEDAGRTSGLEVVRLEIRGAEDIGPAIETVKGRADALIVVTEPLANTNSYCALTRWHSLRDFRRCMGRAHMSKREG